MSLPSLSVGAADDAAYTNNIARLVRCEALMTIMKEHLDRHALTGSVDGVLEGLLASMSELIGLLYSPGFIPFLKPFKPRIAPLLKLHFPIFSFISSKINSLNSYTVSNVAKDALGEAKMQLHDALFLALLTLLRAVDSILGMKVKDAFAQTKFNGGFKELVNASRDWILVDKAACTDRILTAHLWTARQLIADPLGEVGEHFEPPINTLAGVLFWSGSILEMSAVFSKFSPSIYRVSPNAPMSYDGFVTSPWGAPLLPFLTSGEPQLNRIQLFNEFIYRIVLCHGDEQYYLHSNPLGTFNAPMVAYTTSKSTLNILANEVTTKSVIGVLANPKFEAKAKEVEKRLVYCVALVFLLDYIITSSSSVKENSKASFIHEHLSINMDPAKVKVRPAFLVYGNQIYLVTSDKIIWVENDPYALITLFLKEIKATRTRARERLAPVFFTGLQYPEYALDLVPYQEWAEHVNLEGLVIN